MSAVKGLQGYWHFTSNVWDRNKLKAACGGSVSPNFRELDDEKAERLVDCPKCLRNK